VSDTVFVLSFKSLKNWLIWVCLPTWLCVCVTGNACVHVGRVKPMVIGSIGPYGACQADCSEYTGQYVDNMSIEVISKLLVM